MSRPLKFIMVHEKFIAASPGNRLLCGQPPTVPHASVSTSIWACSAEPNLDSVV